MEARWDCERGVGEWMSARMSEMSRSIVRAWAWAWAWEVIGGGAVGRAERILEVETTFGRKTGRLACLLASEMLTVALGFWPQVEHCIRNSVLGGITEGGAKLLA